MITLCTLMSAFGGFLMGWGAKGIVQYWIGREIDELLTLQDRV